MQIIDSTPRAVLHAASSAALGLAWLVGAPTAAQDRVIHDTLGPDLPTGVTCGFCAGERFGVVFRELPPPRQGIAPTDFPLTLRAVQIAVAAATVSAGPSCAPAELGGAVLAPVEVYAGDVPPTGSIVSLAAEGPWSETERLVWAAEAPLERSVAPAGGGGYEVRFNALEVRDEEGQPIRIESGRYLRVVVTLPSDGSACLAGAGESPAAFPIRDGDGVIAPERSFLYASGVGWLWNEAARVEGDWGIRLEVARTPSRPDGGVAADGGPSSDAGGPDAGGMIDAGRVDAGGGSAGGGCRAAPGEGRAGCLAALLGLLAVSAARVRARGGRRARRGAGRAGR